MLEGLHRIIFNKFVGTWVTKSQHRAGIKKHNSLLLTMVSFTVEVIERQERSLWAECYLHQFGTTQIVLTASHLYHRIENLAGIFYSVCVVAVLKQLSYRVGNLWMKM